MPNRPMQHLVFIATDDRPELGVEAGDRFYWQYTSEGPKVRQVRKRKNAAILLQLVDEGVLVPEEDSAPQADRQAVGAPPPPPSLGPRLLE